MATHCICLLVSVNDCVQHEETHIKDALQRGRPGECLTVYKKQLQLRSIVLMPHNISRLMGSAVNLNLFYDGNDLPFRDVSSLNPFTGEANFVHQRDCEVCRREPNQATFRVRFFSLLKTISFIIRLLMSHFCSLWML